MATTDKIINGSNLLIHLNGTPIAMSRTASISMSTTLVDSTTKDSELWASSIPTVKAWSATCDGLVEYPGLDELSDAYINSTLLEVSFEGRATVAGDVVFTGFAYIESLEVNADQNEAVTFTVSFTGSGKLVKTIVTA